MNVLYIDGAGPFGGAARSLVEVLRAMPAGAVHPHVVVQKGTATAWYRTVAVDLIAARGIARFDNTRYSHYRGVRWLVLLRELAYVPFTLAALLRARLRWNRRIELIHANEVTEIVPLLLARWLFRAPAVVHVRAVQRNDSSAPTRWLHGLLRRCEAIVAIDENVRASLPAPLPVVVIHNSFTPARPARPEPALIERLRALRPGVLRVGFVGSLHRVKGLFDLIEAAAIVRREGREVDYVIVGGETRADRGLAGWLLRRAGLSQNAGAELRAEALRLGLNDCIHFLGHTADITTVYDHLDVVCFPTHLDAPGRPIFEAAFSGVPAIAAISVPRPDTMIPGETGLSVLPRSPAQLAEAIMYCADHRDDVKRMGANARRFAERNFSPQRNAALLLDLYRRIRRDV